MKYLIILFSLFLIGCSNSECTLSQIPSQVLIAGPNCTASLPDYRLKVTVTGCAGITVTQTPPAGFQLTELNKTANVVIKAIAANGKYSQISFLVTMIDTITPKIVPLDEFFSTQIVKIAEIYTLADAMYKDYTEKFDKVFPWESIPGLKPNVDHTDMENIWVDSLNVPLRKFPQ